MKPYRFLVKSLFLLTSINLMLSTACSFIPGKKPKLYRPAGGITITGNVPVFSWKTVECDYYQIWINGIEIDSVPAGQNRTIPFPMSYGTHRWHVVAVTGGTGVSSDTAEFTIDDKPLTALPDGAVLLRDRWKVCSSVLSGRDGSALSGRNAGTAGWKSSSVPATVLSVLVRNGIYPNPYIGLNNMKIPDCSDEFNREYDLLKYSHLPGKNPWKEPYWYRREFDIPVSYRDRKVWLTLGEINYRAEVWLNGQMLADTSGVVGMERSFRFDISSVVDFEDENILAIAIYPPDHPGKPDPPPLTPLADPGTNMADGMISRDYTRWDVLGWDWIPAVRDRDMGITEDVFIHATDAIEIDNLYVTSDLPLPDTSYADLTISLDLVNHSNRVEQGTIQAFIVKGDMEIILEEPFTLRPNDTIRFLWNRDNMPRLHLEDPLLWWPNGYGNPELYNLSVKAIAGSGEQSGKQLRFGIREVETYIGTPERVYRINGRDIYCKGGNWVLDMTLNWTASRYLHEIQMTRHANLNLLRIWGPTGAPPEVFYDAADEYGIMLWQDFLNDYWGTFRNTPGYRPEESLFRKATISIVKKYRNHPSLVIWGSGNEGPNPREEMIMNDILPQYDGRDSKHYLKISNGDGLHGGGPYHTILPEAYFTHPKLNGFSSEIGPSGVPVFESVMKFMPEAGKDWMPERFPLDGTWAYHDANDWPGSDLRKFSSYDNIIRRCYGVTDSASLQDVETYLDKCQLLNHDVYRASMEAINSQLWMNSSGILLWKSNASWPGMTWQIYDWYLQAHAGYYGVKKSAAPVSIYYNRKSRQVEVLNARWQDIDRARVSAVLVGTDMTEIRNVSEIVDLKMNRVTALMDTVPVTANPCFLKLTLTGGNGQHLADNFYWLSSNNDFRSLDTLPEPELRISSKRRETGDRVLYTFTITNTGKNIALMTRLKLADGRTGLEILPSFWSGNYVSLLPGERQVLQVETDIVNLPEEILLYYKAYNMARERTYKP